MQHFRDNVTYARLRELLHYDPETGVFNWAVSRRGVRPGRPAGCLDHRGYILIGIDRELYMAHRLAVLYMTKKWPPADTDHRDRNKSNNRWENLRLASRTDNNGNSKAKRPNNLKGASQKPNGRWMAQIVRNKTHYYLGLYDTKEQAHEAYCRMAVKLYGEFARFSE